MAFVVERQRFFNRNNNYKPSSSSNYNASRFSGNKPITGIKRAGSYYYYTHCKIPGHSLERCFRLHGCPPDYKPSQKRFDAAVHGDEIPTDVDVNHNPAPSTDIIQLSFTMEKYQKLLDMLTDSGGNSQKSDTSHEASHEHTACFAGKFCYNIFCKSGWVLDSGATDHICHDFSLFQSYKVLDNIDNTITVPDGRKIQITHIGTIILNDFITLHQVLYVPGFHFNLISIPKSCHDFSGIVSFFANCCTLQGPSLTEPIVLSKLQSGLYYVEAPLWVLMLILLKHLLILLTVLLLSHLPLLLMMSNSGI